MLDHSALLSSLVCPACGSPLQSFTHCNHCGAEYGESDGTPVLISAAAHRQVSFEFSQTRSTVGKEFQNCFSYPPKCGAAGSNKPYHLDLAHLDVFERLPSESLILEIGCGGGQMRSYLESKQLRYVGIDISKTRVYQHLQLHGGPDLLCDSHFLPFKNGTFDVVYSAAVTEHFACPYLAVQEVKRVLKPGGYYLGNVSFLEPWHDDSFFHMSPLGVFELLTQANLEIVHIWPGLGYSGFRSICNMGNKATRPMTFVGDLLYFIYNTGNRLRNLVKPRKHNRSKVDIMDAARVSGSTDWIARRRLEG